MNNHKEATLRHFRRFSAIDLAHIGMGAALVTVSTLFLKVPTPATGGYVNLGDVLVIFLGFRLGARNGAMAAGIGSAIADITGGYAIFFPVTFLAKGLEGGLAGLFGYQQALLLPQIKAATSGAFVMVVLYTLWNWTILGFAPASASVPANMLQGAAGITGAIFLQRAALPKAH